MIHVILVFENYTTWKIPIIRSKVLPGKVRSEKVCSLKSRKQD